jgi:hypothetical protein
MTAHIYIIKDGDKTKIGKSTNLERRLPAYKTHNPNHEVYKTYPCTAEQAHSVELFIKQAMRDRLAGQGRERFSVPAVAIDRLVCTLLDASPGVSDTMPALHGVKVSHDADGLLGRILAAVQKGEPSQEMKDRLSEMFGRAFGLGIPRHKLPDDVLAREYLTVDLNHSADPRESEAVRKAVRSNEPFPHSDHCWHFFHLLRLSSGHNLAVCTAVVSMPYMEALGHDGERRVFNHAKELGLWATFHHDWSWWYPSKTALILFQRKTPVSQLMTQWEGSFRKWVMERREVLRFEDHGDSDALLRIIEDVCDDKHFPLSFRDYGDLWERYLGPFWHFLSAAKIEEDGWDDDRVEAMRFLIGKWREQR